MQMLSVEDRRFPFAAEQDTFDKSMAVNLNPCCSTSSRQERQRCTQALWTQLESNGFAYVCGLPITRELAQDALRMTNDFLQSADENVRRSCLTRDRARRGYRCVT